MLRRHLADAVKRNDCLAMAGLPRGFRGGSRNRWRTLQKCQDVGLLNSAGPSGARNLRRIQVVLCHQFANHGRELEVRVTSGRVRRGGGRWNQSRRCRRGWFRFGFRRSCRRCCLPFAVINDRQHSAHFNGGAGFNIDGSDRAADRRRDFHLNLVCADLEQQFAGFDGVTDRFVPDGEGAFGDRLP